MSSKRGIGDRSDISDYDQQEKKKSKDYDTSSSVISDEGNMAGEIDILESNEARSSGKKPIFEENVTLTATKFTLFFRNALSDPAVRDELKNLLLPQLSKKLDDQKLEIENMKSHINNLEYEVDNLQQYSRRNSLRIAGMPERENENTDNIVLKLCNEQLNVPVTSADIDRSHRVGSKPADSRRSRAILVKFVRYRVREQVYKARSSLKHTRDFKSVYVNEDLTHKRAILAKKARELCKDKPDLLENTWVRDGKIFVKETINHGGRVKVLTAEEDLTKYLRFNVNISSETPVISSQMRRDITPVTSTPGRQHPGPAF